MRSSDWNELVSAIEDLRISVRDYGAVGDGVTNDTNAFLNWIADLDANTLGVVPAGTYKVTSTLTFPDGDAPSGVSVLWNNARIEATLPNAPVIEMGQTTQFFGRLGINCNSQSGSIGVRFDGVKYASIARLEIVSAGDCGVMFYSSDDDGTYYNRIDYLHVRYGTGDGVRFETHPDFANQANANHIGFASIQNVGGSAVVVDGGDGNAFSYLEAESNTGWGFDLVRGLGFYVPAGWLEGNTAGEIRIADDPDVRGVYITCQSDGTMATSVSHTHSGNRQVFLNRQDLGYSLGAYGMALLAIGDKGVAAVDQDIAGNRFKLVSGMVCYRRSASDKFFTFLGTGGAGVTPTGYRWYEDGGTTLLLQADSTNGLRVPQTVKAISTGLDLSPSAGNQNVRVLTSGTGKFLVNDGVGIEVHAAGTVRTGRGATASRPAAATVGSGASFFDETLGKPIWSTGSAWVDATGATV